MGDIQFVFEKPQTPAQTVKRRSRLITSCDACRSKKIKCRPAGRGDDKCKSCESSGSICIFDERNRIRSQRGIASFTVAPTCRGRKIRLRGSSPSASVVTTGTIVNEELCTPGASSSTLSARNNLSQPECPSFSIEQSCNTAPSHASDHGGEQCLLNGSLDDILLFDPCRQAYPHPRLLPHLVDMFLSYAGSIFPFFDPVELVRAAREGILSPLIANCLAAYAARFSDEIHHSPGSRHLSGEAFLETAKGILSGVTSSNLERLHATILVAWTENGSGRTHSFLTYSQMASSQAAELRLDSEECICQDPCEESRNRSRLTFWSVVWLDIIACSVNGKSCTLRLDECSTGMPYPEIKSCGTLPRTVMYQAFRGVLNLMILLNVCSNSGTPSTPSERREIGLRHLQFAAMTIKERLPLSLAFNKENMLLSMPLRESFAFYLVHVLIHCFLVVSHCPSIFWTSQSPMTVTELPRLDIAWSSAIAIVDILNLMRNESITFATGISSTFLPLSIARGAFMLARGDIESMISGTNMTVEDFEFTNSFYLAQSAEMLQSLSRYWANMLHVEISAEPVALCGIGVVSHDLRYAPSPLRTLSLNHTWQHPPSGGGSFDYLDGRKGPDRRTSESQTDTDLGWICVNFRPTIKYDVEFAKGRGQLTGVMPTNND